MDGNKFSKKKTPINSSRVGVFTMQEEIAVNCHDWKNLSLDPLSSLRDLVTFISLLWGVNKYRDQMTASML